ncbi:MAG: hypothetical protein J5656_05880, partial [Clostridia bacterium]|nr:hypothetical protein [Clostridia bacterium]
MKGKSKDEKVILGLVLLMLILVLIIFIGCIFQVSAGDVAKASNEETSALCLLNGTWSYIATTAGYTNEVSGTGSQMTYLDRDLVEMQMFSLYTDGTQTINPGSYINWKNVTIYARVNTSISGHESFVLKRDGTTLISNTLTGTTSKALYTGCLEDGLYEFTYKFTYAPSSSTVCKYTFSFSFNVDNTDPESYLYGNGGEIENGGSINKEFNFYTTDTHLKGIYVKGPNESTYTFYANNSSYTVYSSSTQGMYYFYSEDLAGNTSDVFYTYLDANVPSVKMQVGSNTYTNSNAGFVKEDVKIYAEDGSPWTIYYRKGNTGNYSSSTSMVTLSEEGKYTVYAIDQAGNMSDGYTVIIDKTKPSITMKYDSHNIYQDGDMVRTQVKVNVTDNLSGIHDGYYERVNGSDTSDQTFTTNTSFDMEGEYTITVTDNAGNVEVVKITIDQTPPYATYKSGFNTYYNYGHVNNSFKISVQDNFSTNNTIEIKKDYEVEYVDITDNPNVSEEGFYLIKLTDQAGNYVVEYFTLDLTKPNLHIYVNG